MHSILFLLFVLISFGDSRGIREVSLAAMSGETLAQLELGIRKYKDQDFEEAAKWLSRSADQGNALAQFNYGFLLEKGLGVSTNTTSACSFYQKSANQANIKAKFRLARCHELGLNGKQNLELAYYHYLSAAEDGDLLSRLRLGRAFEKGQLGTKNLAFAVAWFTMAANMNSRRAKKWLSTNTGRLEASVESEVQRILRGNFRNLFWNDLIGKVRMRFRSKYYNEETRKGITKLRYREILAGELYLITLEFKKNRLVKISFEGGYTKAKAEFDKLRTILSKEYKSKPQIIDEPGKGILSQATWQSTGLYYDTIIDLQLTGRKELFDISEVTGITLVYRPKPRELPK